jgi:hypothetical protein
VSVVGRYVGIILVTSSPVVSSMVIFLSAAEALSGPCKVKKARVKNEKRGLTLASQFMARMDVEVKV